ncbi:hypothetical protein [Bordetella genomosp. 13]|uniref:hypothetical protein n=1 Tax=Bordetella genomosp. 13 TaxID=463040 RepID=UPI0016427F2C|nr:hypothetical protein [Bordetella genomosp. 13]
MKIMNKYGIVIKPRTEATRPVDIKLTGKEGSRVVLSAAKRVLVTHEKVIKALANR